MKSWFLDCMHKTLHKIKPDREAAVYPVDGPASLTYWQHHVDSVALKMRGHMELGGIAGDGGTRRQVMGDEGYLIIYIFKYKNLK